MSKEQYIETLEIDTRSGFKDAKEPINRIIQGTDDLMIDIKNNSVDKGHAQIIIVFEKAKKKNFKE